MPNEPAGLLRDMIEHKRAEVARARAAIGMAEMEAMVAQADPPRNFFRAVTRHPDAVHISVIAEVKRRGLAPGGAGWIRPEFEGDGFKPETIAEAYYRNGAAAISCATDERFAGGRLEWLDRVRHAVPLPVLRRDVIIDPWQLWETRAAGADAVVLIAECLNESEIVDMLILAQQLQLTVLLEVHDMENLLRVIPHVGFPHPGYFLLGLNNRDWTTMRADLNHTLRLADVADKMIHDRSILVTDSGITSREDLLKVRTAGVRIAVVGEHLLGRADPGAALGDLLRSRFEAM